MNQVTIAGHLGADPEVRFTSSGKKVSTLRVAARARKNSKDETIWWKVTIWGDQFDKIIPYFKKGHPIIVMGELSPPEMFTDREGKTQVSMNITAQYIGFSPFGKPDGAHNQSSQEASPMAQQHSHSSTADVFQGLAGVASSSSSFGQGKMEMNFSDDEIPF